MSSRYLPLGVDMASLLSQHQMNAESNDEPMMQTHIEHSDQIDGPLSGDDENVIPPDPYMSLSDPEQKMHERANPLLAESCHVCGKVVSNIKKHLKSHNPEQHKCPLCPIVLTRADNLKRHIRMKHCSVLKSSNLSNVLINPEHYLRN